MLEKRYVLLIVVSILTLLLVYHLKQSYAYNEGYQGKMIVNGRNWGVNITEISDVNLVGEAHLLKDISSIATTLNINVVLEKPGDEINFDFTVTNTSKLNAELYAITLQGLSSTDSEFISYTITPSDYVLLHTDEIDGSIIKKDDKQTFHVEIKYLPGNIQKEFNLGLGSTIIYKQK